MKQRIEIFHLPMSLFLNVCQIEVLDVMLVQFAEDIE